MAEQSKGERTEARLLAVARSTFAELGYERVSMREIAARAGLSAPAVYVHFKDKETLYMEALLSGLSQSTERIMRAARSGKTPKDQLTRFIGALAEVVVNDQDSTRLVERHLISGERSQLGVAVQTAFTSPFALLGELLEQVTGTKRPTEDAAAVYALTLGLMQFSQLLDTSSGSSLRFHQKPKILAKRVIEILIER